MCVKWLMHDARKSSQWNGHGVTNNRETRFYEGFNKKPFNVILMCELQICFWPDVVNLVIFVFSLSKRFILTYINTLMSTTTYQSTTF